MFNDYLVVGESMDALINYYKLACHTFGNAGDDSLDYNHMHDSYLKGVDCWNALLNKWIALHNDPDTTRKTFFCENNPNASDHSGSELSLLRTFFELADSQGTITDDDNRIDFLLGEGRALINEGSRIVDFLEYQKSHFTIDVTCGPVIVERNKSVYNDRLSLNDFVYSVSCYASALLADKKLNFKLSCNKFIAFAKGFAGYFHSYIFGDTIMFETMHKLDATADKAWFFLVDRDCADMARSFFDDYKRDYTRSVDTSKHDEMVAAYYTYPVSEYERTFGGSYINELLEIAGIA